MAKTENVSLFLFCFKYYVPYMENENEDERDNLKKSYFCIQNLQCTFT